MTTGTIEIQLQTQVEPWVYRYLDMVKARVRRTGQLPLMDIVEAVIKRGIRISVVDQG